ncbi:MAG: HAMP domain-containing histidine kinase [Chloroflexi bacterium]|nr:HAMP domain-containing histidine kinase [Chloroflexota bacterium]
MTKISSVPLESNHIAVSTDADTRLADQFLELERENAAMRQSLAVVSHELRTPLTSIVAFCDLLLRNRDDRLGSREMDQLKSVSRNASVLTEIIKDLGEIVAFGRQKDVSIVKTSIDAADLIDETAKSMRPILESAGQTLIVQSPIPGSVIQADRSRIHQALGNLLTNASKFSSPSSQIDLAAEVDDSRFYVQIVDRGIGIPSEELSKVFDNFYRAENGSGAVVPGLGLGLFVTREIIHAHGGNISIKSSPGRGTTVSFAIPRECEDTISAA